MIRSNTYTQGNAYRLIPIARQPVVPGQSLSIDLDLHWETAAFTNNLLTGGMANIYAFYVPYRLVWDEWIDFVSDPQSAAVIPTTTTPFPELFERGTTGVNVFARRAFKLIYNQYFGSDQFGSSSYYADINLDTDVSLKRVRTTDQYLGKLMTQASTEDLKYSAPVVGTAPSQFAEISFNDFRQAMKNARSDRRADMTGDKYVDAMRRMGVQLNWAMQMAPEFLGQVQKDFASKETRASYTPADPAPAGAAVTGKAYARFAEDMRFKTPRKFFGEHGIVITLLVVRPHVMPVSWDAPFDSQLIAREQFFLGDNQTGIDAVNATNFGSVAATPVYSPRFQYYLSGQNMIGQVGSTSWYGANDGATFDDLVWPSFQQANDGSISELVGVCTSYRGLGPTLVRRMSH